MDDSNSALSCGWLAYPAYSMSVIGWLILPMSVIGWLILPMSVIGWLILPMSVISWLILPMSVSRFWTRDSMMQSNRTEIFHISTSATAGENVYSRTHQFFSVLRIRIYYYADPDPGSKKCPYRSGS